MNNRRNTNKNNKKNMKRKNPIIARALCYILVINLFAGTSISVLADTSELNIQETNQQEMHITYNDKTAEGEMMPILDTVDESRDIAEEISEPTISLDGLTGGDPQLLVNNPGYSDFDFNAVSGNKSNRVLTVTNGYFIYDYMDIVEISSVDLIGWWPTHQGVKNLGFSYWKNGKREEADQNVEIAWVTPSNSSVGVQEEYTVMLDEPVETSKFRIQVNSAYSAWSEKMNMRLMAPRGIVIREMSAIYQEIQAAQDYVNSVMIGDLPGEFPQSAVDELQRVLFLANEQAEDPNITENQINEIISVIKDALSAFLQKQNPLRTKWNIGFYGLTIAAGEDKHLLDGQYATYVTFSEYGDMEDAYIEFCYLEEGSFQFQGLQFMAPDALKTAPSNINVEYFDGDN